MPATALERLYKKLFQDPTDSAALVELKNALDLLSAAAGSDIPVKEVLTRLNDGQDPGLTLQQLFTLKKLFEAPRKLAPVQEGVLDALEGRRFFHALVFASTDNVERLWALLHAYHLENPEPVARANVVSCLDQMVPGVEWTEEKLVYLNKIAVRDRDFHALAWWNASANAW